MMELEHSLTRRLRELRVKVETPDEETVLLRNVPTGKGFFNKPRTNLLIKRPRRGMPMVVCVDEDLRYTGSDVGMVRAFAAGASEQGWRAIYLRAEAGDFRRAVEEALAAVGFDGRPPSLYMAGPVDEDHGLLDCFGEKLSGRAMMP